ncbi:MAG TPA: hypothetical protein PKC22_16845, partial [Rhodocyclaceae bacterium]|nr:hypothetical protein [Rhodocyclaceae bacterium]
MEGSRGPKRTLRGDDARRLIQDQVTAHSDGLRAALRPYQPRSAVRAWHDTIHAIEEFINIPLFVVDDEAAVRSLLS